MISWIPVAVFVIAAFVIVGLLLKALKDQGDRIFFLSTNTQKQHQSIKTYENHINDLQKQNKTLTIQLANEANSGDSLKRESAFHKERWEANAREALRYRQLLEQREKQVQRLKNVKKKKKVRR